MLDHERFLWLLTRVRGAVVSQIIRMDMIIHHRHTMYCWLYRDITDCVLIVKRVTVYAIL